MKRFIALLIAVLLLFSAAAAESRWVLCKNYVNVRIDPDKQSEIVGYLDACDEFETDGTARNGYIQVMGIGEAGCGWIFAGFSCDEKPEKVNGRFVCVARRRVACRRWTDGPRIRGKIGWLYNGSNVTVYFQTSEWSVTSRGYIATEWLERDPE